ncbi:MAG TPA: 5-formyltetrahydrofolate cyclo-ligase [Geobacteraceae bacterium]|nr:5-formyltetrahydrofolate cyclo-ligase [Geobacteraceae bacterium]
MPKSALRTRMLVARNHLSEEEQLSAAILVQASLTGLPEYAAAGSVALYAAFRSEVPTIGIIRQSLSEGKEVLLPAVEKSGLVFRRISSDADLIPGKYGIPEPSAGCKPSAVDSIDLFVIPGVAFDLQGHRVGYGRGYYDRALHRFESGGKLIGICYDFQLVDEIAGEPHDVIMDMVITERRAVTPVLLK